MRKALGVLLAVIALTVGGCGANDSASSKQGASFPVKVSTPAGDVTVESKPSKIVSLAPTATEMLFEVGAGAQVKAVDELSNFPANAPKTALSGYRPNLEAIVAEGPDLVLVSNDINGIVAALRERKIPTFIVPAANTLDDTYSQLVQIGRLTGHLDRAEDLVEEMKNEVAKIAADVPRRDKPISYYYELDPTYFSVTSKTFIGSVLSVAGLRNIADDVVTGNNYPQLSSEAIVAANPDVILLADSKCCGQNQATVAQRPGWSNVAAVKNGHVVALDDDVASRWGPRIIDLLRQVADATKSM